MADVQLEHGYTRIANELLEAKIRFGLSSRQSQIFDYVTRFTYGYQRKTAVLNYNHMSDMTGIARNHCYSTVLDLSVMNILVLNRDMKACEAGINKGYAEWKALPKKDTSPKSGHNDSQKRTKPSPKSGHHIKKVVKESLKEKLQNLMCVNDDWISEIHFPGKEPEDYKRSWNYVAHRNKWPEIKAMSDKRIANIKARQKEKAFDWLEILKMCEKYPKLFYTFDFLMASTTNYLKVLEGNYKVSFDNGPQPPAQPEQSQQEIDTMKMFVEESNTHKGTS